MWPRVLLDYIDPGTTIYLEKVSPKPLAQTNAPVVTFAGGHKP